MEPLYFDINFHHKGRFSGTPLEYVGGEIYEVPRVELDLFSFFCVRDLVRGFLGYADDHYKLWWKRAEESFDLHIKQICLDKDAMEVSGYVQSGARQVEIYLEHTVELPVEEEAVEEVQQSLDANNKGKQVMEDKSDSTSYYESDSRISWSSPSASNFTDSENERIKELPNDGFEDDDEPNNNATVDQPETGRREKLPSRRNIQRVLALCEGENEPGDSAGDEHNLDQDYYSDELVSDLSSGEEDNGRRVRRYVRFKKEDLTADYEFKLGMEFSSTTEFKNAIHKHSVLNGKQVKFKKNDTDRVRYGCKDKDCGFLVYCAKIRGLSTYRIKTLIPQHTCGRSYNNKNAGAKFIAECIEDRVKNSGGDIAVKDVMNVMKSQHSIGVTWGTARNARKIAKERVEGDAVKQYTLLRAYAAELMRVNHKNTAALVCKFVPETLQPRFGSFYMCLEGCKTAFTSTCRPFIGVDGCHLKTKYGGILLIAVGRDPNDQYFPLAFAVVESECKESWRWFLHKLLRDIGDKRWVFISDKQKGLLQVFDEELPGVEHRFCVRHLYSNFKKKFGGGTEIRDVLMWASKATYKALWEEKMQEIKDMNVDAYNWLHAIPTKYWCKHAFSPYPKCDVTMNNLAEAFNSTILVARDKPIITMLEWIRKYLMTRFANLNEKSKRWKGNVMPKPRRRLDREIKHCGDWQPFAVGKGIFEVEHTKYEIQKFVVDLGKQTCTCNFWELVGIPCRHAVACICDRGLKPEDYVHWYYTREAYDACYGNMISPINGEKMWPKQSEEPILPPEFKRGPGRPKKLRRREPDEANPTKLSRGGSSYTCSRCHQKGHNQRKCHLPKPPTPGNTDEEPEENDVVDLSQVFGINVDASGNEATTAGAAVTGVSAEGTAAAMSSSQPARTTRAKATPEARVSSSQPAPTSAAKPKAPPKATSKPPPKSTAAKATSSKPPPKATAPKKATSQPQQAPTKPPQPPKATPQPPKASSQPPPTKPPQPPKATAKQPPKAAAPTNTRSAAKSAQGGRKRARDNEIGHWIPTGSTIGGGRAKAVGSEGQGNKRKMSKK